MHLTHFILVWEFPIFLTKSTMANSKVTRQAYQKGNSIGVTNTYCGRQLNLPWEKSDHEEEISDLRAESGISCQLWECWVLEPLGQSPTASGMKNLKTAEVICRIMLENLYSHLTVFIITMKARLKSVLMRGRATLNLDGTTLQAGVQAWI